MNNKIMTTYISSCLNGQDGNTCEMVVLHLKLRHKYIN